VVSIASLWEIAIKRSLGKLSAPDDLSERISDEGCSWLTLTASHAREVRRVPVHHRDPFDRLLVAQALIERLPIITADPRFRPYGVDVRR
jgi:PIN domain nuclease of toxin-antitoxin system